MTLNLLDRSNYFKGLLLLVGKDKKVTEKEKEMMKNLGKTLGFDKEFVDEAIGNLLINEYIKKDPPKFSHKEFAEAFLKDGIKFAIADDELNKDEVEWLHEVALTNSINNAWLRDKLLESIENTNGNGHKVNLDILDYLPN